MKIVLLRSTAFSLCFTAGLEIMKVGNQLLSNMPQGLAERLGMAVNNLVIAFFLAARASLFIPLKAALRDR